MPVLIKMIYNLLKLPGRGRYITHAKVLVDYAVQWVAFFQTVLYSMEEVTMIRTKNLIHPGEILLEEFLKPMGITQNKLALDIHVPAPRIYAIVRGTRAITADTALRLGRYFGTGPEFWINLQSNYDLCVAAAESHKEIEAISQFACV